MDFSKLDGLIPAVVQDDTTKLWMKGETSGNRLKIKSLMTDCDDDTVLVRVERQGDGNVCHTGNRTCFFKELDTGTTT